MFILLLGAVQVQKLYGGLPVCVLQISHMLIGVGVPWDLGLLKINLLSFHALAYSLLNSWF